jgi:hypothetical protein
MAHTPIPVSASDRNAFRERAAGARVGALRTDGGSGPQARGPEFSDDAFPSRMPPFIAATVRSTPDGEIWIGRSHTSRHPTWQYDIHDASGRLTGSATLRAGSMVVGFGTGTVYVARTDSADDLVILERFRR